jgi:hypothetical protein
MLTLLLLFSALLMSSTTADTMPLPFTQPLAQGARDKLVRLVRTLVARTPGVGALSLGDDLFDGSVANALQVFQSQQQLMPSGVLDADTASALLQFNEPDGWRDPLVFPLHNPYLYKVWIPVHRNRTVQATNATLFDQWGNVLLTFVARLHGKNHPDGSQLNQFTSNGVTPTGLFEFDLNSPEPDPVSYGPFPVNRATRGLRGNAVVVISDNKTTTLRSGILMHTGQWANWSPPAPMPNSDGCIHAWPKSIEFVWHALVKLGVQVRKNPFGQLPYPFAAQGLLSVEQVD